MQKADAAAFLAKLSMREKESHPSPTNVHIISGEVSGESENGLSRISVDGLVFAEEDNQYVEMPTIGGLEDGDIASVLLIGEDGKQMTPLAVGAPGSVDRVKNLANSASSLAAQAKAVADAIGQWFWHDSNGAHVTIYPEEEWTDPNHANYHAGPNALWNALGMLFRNGDNNLLALVTGNDPGVVIFNGRGNSENNIVASFVGNLIELGKNSQNAVIKLCNGIGFISVDDSFIVHEISNELSLGVGSEYVKTYGTTYEEHASSYANFTATEDEESRHPSQNPNASLVAYRELTKPNPVQKYGEDLFYELAHPKAYFSLIQEYGPDAIDTFEWEGQEVTGRRSTYRNVLSTNAELLRIFSGCENNLYDITESSDPYEISMNHVVNVLRSSIGTYTGSSSTATASAAGWQLTWFNVVIGEHGSPRNGAYSFSNGVLTAIRDCVLEISGVMNWTDSIAGTRGFGIFYDELGGSNEHSSFQYFSSDVSQRKSVVFPPKLFTLSAEDSLYFGRFQQKNAVYQNGENFSWVTIRVVG